jgi:cell division transport system permease protein
VKLKDPTQYAVVVSAFSGRPGVDVVQDQRSILEKFFKLLNVLRNGALLVGLFSVLTAGLLISNTLRIAAFNRRRETGVMKLVGASSWSIQLPFLLEGIISALIGWVFATGLLAGLKSVVDSKVAPLLTFNNFFGWNEVWVASAWLLLAGLGVSTVASVITLRRYLKV